MADRSRGLSRVPRRRKGWEEGPGQLASQVALAATGSQIVVSGAQLVGDGNTLLRLRGALTMQLSVATGVFEGFVGAFGVGIVQAAAFAVGVTAVPTPIDEQDWDGWLFWMPFMVASITATLTDGANAGSVILRMPIDSRAMRKLDLDDVIYGVLQVQEIGAASLQWHFDSRVLLALP